MNGWLVAGGMALALVSGLFGYHAGQSDAQDTCALAKAEQANTDKDFVIEKQVENRNEEARRYDVVENVSREIDSAVVDTAGSVGVSTAVAERLYGELEAFRSRYNGCLATSDARLAQQREAADARIKLLADLYRESDQAAGRRAEEAEGYRTAGLGCEKTYDGVRNSPR